MVLYGAHKDQLGADDRQDPKPSSRTWRWPRLDTYMLLLRACSWCCVRADPTAALARVEAMLVRELGGSEAYKRILQRAAGDGT